MGAKIDYKEFDKCCNEVAQKSRGITECVV